MADEIREEFRRCPRAARKPIDGGGLRVSASENVEEAGVYVVDGSRAADGLAVGGRFGKSE